MLHRIWGPALGLLIVVLALAISKPTHLGREGTDVQLAYPLVPWATSEPIFQKNMDPSKLQKKPKIKDSNPNLPGGSIRRNSPESW